jgi:uncharacterized membrane protein HdeD (DUF308 family)
MTKKIIGWLLIISGIGNFVGAFGKASANIPNAFDSIGYGVLFLIIGIYLVSTARPKPKE